MAARTKSDPPDFAELDAEREVDLRRYWNALLMRWWLLLAGLIGGLIVGYLLSLGGNQVYKATALLYLGQPFSGTAPIQGLPTNPTFVDQYVRSEFAARLAAARAGLRPGEVRNNVSTKTVTGAKGALRTGQTPLFEISLTGKSPRKVQIAALSLSRQVIDRISPYVDTKIRGYETVLASIEQQLESNQKQIDQANSAIATSSGLSAIDRLVLTTQANNAIQVRGQLLESQATAQQQLALSEQFEKPSIQAPPVAVKTTARSTRNSMLVGALIGLLLGAFAAFLWEPVTSRIRRP
jgi:hypothetical protein